MNPSCDIEELLRKTVALGASDLHLTVGAPPIFRLDGAMHRLPVPAMTRDQIRMMLAGLLTGDQQNRFNETHDLDFGLEIPGVARFRVNVFLGRLGEGAVFRAIPATVTSIEDLGLPPVISQLARHDKGLVLVTGPTGTGKSTTLAAMVDLINRERSAHILTIEDPIEFVHPHKKSLVNQREAGIHTASFATALRAALREDPDVILVGELRDLETIALAISAAETGHLVLATLHTSSAPQTIDRIIDVFPAHQQAQIRTQLSESLQGVIAQSLLPRVGGGRVVALEILVTTAAVRNLIREGKTFQLPSVIETGSAAGMISLAQSLQALVQANKITRDTALAAGIERDLLDGPRLMSQASAKAYMTSAPTKEMPESDPDLADLHPINAAA